ncbi:hypothetical protein Tco_0541780, partial [Tanacetum coccineum]
VAIEAMQMQANIYRLQLQVTFALHLQLAIEGCICSLQLKVAFAACN